MSTAMGEILTTGEVAEALGVPLWTLSSALRRGLVRPPGRWCGPMRAWSRDDVEAARAALAAAGLLPKGN